MARSRASRRVLPAARSGTITFSRAVRLGTRLKAWNTMPTVAFVALPIVAVAVGLLASVAGLRRAVNVDPALAFRGP